MSTISYDYYSDHDMQDPGDYYGGFKEARIMRAGDAERALSQIWTGDWQGSTFTLLLSDFDRSLRQQLASATDRFWTEPWQMFMTTRANRAALGTPYTVFVGPPIDAQPRGPLALEVTLGDIVSQRLITDQHQLPWRIIRDCGLLDPSDAPPFTFAIDENLDLETPEPIIYGDHRRIPDVDPASPNGFEYTPTLLGIETRGSGDWYVWLVAGHAVADIPDVNVVDADGVHTSVVADEGTDWLIPHYAGHLAEFGADYRDIRSWSYGVDRRYSLIYGKVGSTDPDAVFAGTVTLTCFVDGVEAVGDGSSAVITDRLMQYKHFLINFVANAGPASYQSGPWLTNPTWDLFDGPVEIVEESTFTDAAAIAVERAPAPPGSPPPYAAGYIGAAIIGAKAGDRASVKRWIADWNRSCAVRFGINHFGQMRVVMLHPTQAIKDAAPLYIDQYEMLQGSFGTEILWRDQANRVPFRADYEHRTGVWKTADFADAGDSIRDYGREILGQIREYPFAPGITMAWHLAYLESQVVKHPPRIISFDAPVGPDYLNQSLGYLDLGDYIRYTHYAEVGAASEIRLAQIIWHQVQSGTRRVKVLALDCEDLIDYDAVTVATSSSPTNDACAAAMEITQAPFTPFSITLDTTNNPTDTSLDGSPAVWSGTRAYHAAWFTFTPWADGTLFISTVNSDYDTQLAVFTGSCGALTEIQYNDNDPTPGLTSSVLEFAVTNGVPLTILVAGYGPADGGTLVFGLYFTEPE